MTSQQAVISNYTHVLHVLHAYPTYQVFLWRLVHRRFELETIPHLGLMHFGVNSTTTPNVHGIITQLTLIVIIREFIRFGLGSGKVRLVTYQWKMDTIRLM